MDSTVVVLCADHGAPDASEGVADHGQSVSWVDDLAMLNAANLAAQVHFHIEDLLIRSHVSPYIYIDHPKIEELGLDVREVLSVLSTSIIAQPGMAHAVPRWRFEEGSLPSSPMFDRLNRSFHHKRSGDLWLVPLPQWQLGSRNPRAVLTSLHGSPWNYDTFVPVIFMGPGIKARRIHRLVEPRDIAPTLAALLGIKAPSAATGQPLAEVLPE
jgi:arylsulfatase A-like enzyme